MDNGQWTIQNSEFKIQNLAVYDISGRLVILKNLNDHKADAITIDVSHLPRGVYIIKVAGKTGKFVKK
jgi:hypothetical protein